ncbi:MAG TPA: lysine--tRNA ligase [Geminicoccaceae bacterium]|nr:lysine--tRNA ligase [Geminicoccus sp.]HMU51268.1 lysine--tRNA ligase [Geminicoccaceae bacterium]
MSIDRALIEAGKAWPIVEALRLRERVARRPPAKGYVLFETGYGPSGLPHIGTFGEVFRTTMVRQAFARLCDLPTELFAFSDDMDGLRKIPDNIPNPEMVREFLGRPLTAIPDPFGTHPSFGEHMNARLRAFLDRFGFAYSFKSATQVYKSGGLDSTLLKVLERHDRILEVMLPTLGAERQATYSPILPISPKSGRVLQVAIEECRPQSGTVVYRDEDGALTEQPVTGGQCKLQWKADWAARWAALDVDYEMYGKDLIPTAELSSKICRILDGLPPNGFSYELFLDDKGQKISKSKGNGLTIDEWLRYGDEPSLAMFIYRDPRKAKRLYFDVIPRNVDEYEQSLQAYPAQPDEQKLGNPVWHIHDGDPPPAAMPVSFGMLLNLASVVNAAEPEVLWAFISRYAPGANPQSSPRLARLVEGAVAYYQDFVKPTRAWREPTPAERAGLAELLAWLDAQAPDVSGEAMQHEVYEIGKRHGFANLRDWFRGLYEVLLGQSEGPRLGSFFALYGLDNSRRLIAQALAGELQAA